MHRIYSKRSPSPNNHLHGYLQHKIADQNHEDNQMAKHRRIGSIIQASQRQYSPRSKLETTPTSAKSKRSTVGSSGFLNVYQKSPSNSPQRSLERKNPEKRQARADNIHQRLNMIKSKRDNTDVENRYPNRPDYATRTSPQRSVTKPQTSAKSIKKSPTPQTRTSRPDLSYVKNIYSTSRRVDVTPGRQSPRNDLKSALKNSPRPSNTKENPSIHRTPLQQRRIPSDDASQRSDQSRSHQSDRRSSGSRSLRSSGISMTRDNSIERRLDSYMKTRKTASKTAFRLNLTTLFSLDTILWKVTTTHHVRPFKVSMTLTQGLCR